MSMSDVKGLKKLTTENKFTNNKYQVPMLWKESCEELPDSPTTVQVIVKKIRKK